MTEIFRIEMLPGHEGDCILLSYGEVAAPRHILIDCGRKATYRSVKKKLAALPAGERRFELFIITHVDRDHVEGVVELLQDPQAPVTFRDVWFNGYHHLSDGVEVFGAVMGEAVTDALRRLGQKWNRRFKGRSVEIGRVKGRVRLAGGLTLELLSPKRTKLAALIPTWEKECKEAGMLQGTNGWYPPAEPGLEIFGRPDIDALADTPLEGDSSPPNGTSIVVMAEYRGRRALLAADCHPDMLLESLRRLAAAAPGGRIELHAFKLPHHGSRHNVSKEVLALVACRRYLISTNGKFFHHPDQRSIARILKYGSSAGAPQIVFNYRSPETLYWDHDEWRANFGYTTSYPAVAENGTNLVDLLP